MKNFVAIMTVLAVASVGFAADERMEMRRDSIVKAVEKSSPAVVNISTEKIVQRGFFPGGGNHFNDPFFDEFFQRFSQPAIATSLGSGGIFSAEGYIFTNAHVVNRASKIMVTLSDGSQHAADLVNVDVASDLAVIKINVGKPLPFLTLGRSDDLMVGERAIAVGNPFGLSSSVTEGVISALHRDIGAEGRVIFKDILQTDALINPGNSGGPLLNIFGEVIGVTTAMRADAQGIGFAIPVDRVKRSLAGLLDYRRARRIRLGFELEEKYVDTGPRTRLMIKSVDKNGPATASDLRPGDVITAIDGHRLSCVVDYMLALVTHETASIRITVERNGKEFTANLAPAAVPKPDANKLAGEVLGLSVQQMDRGLARDVGIDIDKGVLISGVKKGSPGEKGGLNRDDVILQVNDTLTADLESFALALEASGGPVVSLVILRRQGDEIRQYQADIEIAGRE